MGVENTFIITVKSGKQQSEYRIIATKYAPKSNPNAKPPQLLGEYPRGKTFNYRHLDRLFDLPDGRRLWLQYADTNGTLTSRISVDKGLSWSDKTIEISNWRPGRKSNYIDVHQLENGVFLVFQYLPFILYKKDFLAENDSFRVKLTHDGYPAGLWPVENGQNTRLIIPHTFSGKFFVSEDYGDTWKEIDCSNMTAEEIEIHGFLEPMGIQLKDGTLWVTYRSKQGQYAFETYSYDRGLTWTKPVASRFASGTTYQMKYRIPEGPHKGEILMAWCNQRKSPDEENGTKPWYRPGREQLHLAISPDEGETWHGFRAVNAYPYRYGVQPDDRDRGAADAVVRYHAGRYLIYSGNGNHYDIPNPFYKQREIEVDLDWLYQNFAEDDFSAPGIANDFDNGYFNPWCVFKRVGYLKEEDAGADRRRIRGAQLVQLDGDQILQIRRTMNVYDGWLEPPDVATWNIPNGMKGIFTTFIRLSNTFSGGEISLNDQFYLSSDGYYDAPPLRQSMFRLLIDANGKLVGKQLYPGRYYKLQLLWNVNSKECGVYLDGVRLGNLALEYPTENGISYVRLESTSKKADPGGYFIKSVKVGIP